MPLGAFLCLSDSPACRLGYHCQLYFFHRFQELERLVWEAPHICTWPSGCRGRRRGVQVLGIEWYACICYTKFTTLTVVSMGSHATKDHVRASHLGCLSCIGLYLAFMHVQDQELELHVHKRMSCSTVTVVGNDIGKSERMAIYTGTYGKSHRTSACMRINVDFLGRAAGGRRHTRQASPPKWCWPPQTPRRSSTSRWRHSVSTPLSETSIDWACPSTERPFRTFRPPHLSLID